MFTQQLSRATELLEARGRLDLQEAQSLEAGAPFSQRPRLTKACAE